MGNTYNSKLQQHLGEYEVVSRSQEEDVIHLKEKKGNRQVLLKEVFAAIGAEKWNMEGLLRNRLQLAHQHVLFPRDYLVNEERKDSSQPAAWIIYEFPGRNLEQERCERTAQGSPFDEGELWSILASVILSHSYLQTLNIRNESLRSKNIFINSEGAIKVLDPLCNELLTNYRIRRTQPLSAQKAYISPSQLHSLRNNKRYPVHNSYKSTVYTAGIILLELGLLKQINGETVEEVREYLAEMERRYSRDLVVFLREMLRWEEEERMHWVHLERYAQKDSVGIESRMSRVSDRCSLKMEDTGFVTERNSEDTFTFKGSGKYPLRDNPNTTQKIPSFKKSGATFLSPPLRKNPADCLNESANFDRKFQIESNLSSIDFKSRITTFRSLKSEHLSEEKSEVATRDLGQEETLEKRPYFEKEVSNFSMETHSRLVLPPQPSHSPGRKILTRNIPPAGHSIRPAAIWKPPQQQSQQRSTSLSKMQPSVRFIPPTLTSPCNQQKPIQKIFNTHLHTAPQINCNDFRNLDSAQVFYTDQTSKGLKHGKGRLISSDGSGQKGAFDSDHLHGHGVIISKGAVVKGLRSDNRPTQFLSKY